MHERTDFSRHPDLQPKGQAARASRACWRKDLNLGSSSWTTPRLTARFCSTATSTRARALRALRRQRGACYARNLGAQRRTPTAFLPFRINDDLWRPDKLPQYDLHGHQTRPVLLRREPRCRKRQLVLLSRARRTRPRAGELFWPRTGPAPDHAHARAVWEAVRFDGSIRRYQDWDFAIGRPSASARVPAGEHGGWSLRSAATASPRLRIPTPTLRLYESTRLYRRFPRGDAVMNRRLGKRCHPTDPARAAAPQRISGSARPELLPRRLPAPAGSRRTDTMTAFVIFALPRHRRPAAVLRASALAGDKHRHRGQRLPERHGLRGFGGGIRRSRT